MSARLLVVLILTLCVAAPRSVSAQSPAFPARVGARIRVQRFDARHPRTGTLISRSSDSLTVEWQNGARESMPIFEVERMDVSAGHRHYVKLGMVGGLVVGAGVGLIIRGFSGGGDPTSDTSPYLSSDTQPRSNVLGIATGGGIVLGALAGAMGTERWQSTPVGQGGSRVGLIAPSRPAGLRIGLSAKF